MLLVIGANFVLQTIAETGEAVVNLDKLTYAGSLANLEPLAGDARHQFVKGDICDRELVRRLLSEHRPRAIVHFAAESHVDRSIEGPAEPAFTEARPYAPNSPYAASKAAADHLVRAYHATYALPVLTCNCSNNYGPRQFPEKLIPLVITHALAGKPLPVYGDGLNVRDWLYVLDHCRAIRLVLKKGRAGKSYNISGGAEKTNLEVVKTLCALLDQARPRQGGSYAEQIAFVKDRPGHDRRYAMDSSRIARELGWQPRGSFESGLRKTVDWYLGKR